MDKECGNRKLEEAKNLLRQTLWFGKNPQRVYVTPNVICGEINSFIDVRLNLLSSTAVHTIPMGGESVALIDLSMWISYNLWSKSLHYICQIPSLTFSMM